MKSEESHYVMFLANHHKLFYWIYILSRLILNVHDSGKFGNLYKSLQLRLAEQYCENYLLVTW